MSYDLMMPFCFGIVTILGFGRTVAKAIQVDRYRRQGWRRWVGCWLGSLLEVFPLLIWIKQTGSSRRCARLFPGSRATSDTSVLPAALVAWKASDFLSLAF
jgi:hypothetical protein